MTIGAWAYIIMILHVPLYKFVCVEQCLPFPYSSQGFGVHNCPTDLGIAHESCYIDNIKTCTDIHNDYILLPVDYCAGQLHSRFETHGTILLKNLKYSLVQHPNLDRSVSPCAMADNMQFADVYCSPDKRCVLYV